MARKNLLNGLVRPRSVTLFKEKLTPHYGRLVASPFGRGYGTTVANSLRRVLLSSIMGYAVSAVRVTCHNAKLGDHMLASEFEAIPGMVEDTPDFLANLKLLDIALDHEEPGRTLLLQCRGEGTLTAAVLAEHGVRVANPEALIARTMPDADFEIELQIELGRGYRSAEESVELIDVVGTIPLDCVFSPIKKVAFSVEKTRVGEKADFDKLILEVWSNGLISPEDAVGEAAKIVKDSMTPFINFDESLILEEVQMDESDRKIKAFLDTPIDSLELSVRSSNCLKSVSIFTVSELLRSNEDEISKTKNFGKKSLQEIKDRLAQWGLTLGMGDYSQIKKVIQLDNWG